MQQRKLHILQEAELNLLQALKLPVFYANIVLLNISNLPFRLHKLKEMFISKFGSAPKFYARAPGRVNLIGKREKLTLCCFTSSVIMEIQQFKTQNENDGLNLIFSEKFLVINGKSYIIQQILLYPIINKSTWISVLEKNIYGQQ